MPTPSYSNKSEKLNIQASDKSYTASIKSYPDSTTQSPPDNRRLEDHHRQELQESWIDDSLIRLNHHSLKVEPYGARDEALEILYDLDTVNRDNTGRISGAFLRKHNFLNDGALVAQGLDLNTGQPSDFLCLKPDSPRRDRDGKPIKYEHPRGKPTGIFVPRVSFRIAAKIALRSKDYGFKKEILGRIKESAPDGLLQTELGVDFNNDRDNLEGDKHHVSRKSGFDAGVSDRSIGSSRSNRDTSKVRRNSCIQECREINVEAALIKLAGGCRAVGNDGVSSSGVEYETTRCRLSGFLLQRCPGFWELVKRLPVRVTITEGFKKAESLLTQGECAIGLPGIWNWIDQDAEKYVNFKGEEKRRKELTRYLKPLTQVKREFILAFDEDTKAKTRKNVAHAQKVLGKVLRKEGCKVSIASWQPEDGKGIDDAIAKNGSEWLEQTYQRRLSLSAWQYFQKLSHIDKELNKPFLTKDDLSSTAKLLGIKSAKGTGKTEAIADLVQEHIKKGTRVVVLTHRVQLAKELSDRLGIDSAYNFRTSETKGVLGMGLCVDSLHKESQVGFNPDEWDDCVVIIDEVEQVVAHLLTSTGTDVAKHRTEVLSNVSSLCQSASQIILSDADLSDSSLRYVESIMGGGNKSILCNDFKKAEGRKVFSYASPESLLMSMRESMQRGEKVLIPLDCQKAKSTWGSINIESFINQAFPEAKVLRIDAESIGDKNHPAYRIIENLEAEIKQYDIVIYTPVLSTGVSIDLPDYFDAIYSFNQGTQSENSTRQMLSRLRDNIPIHLFLKKIGNGKLDGGETEVNEVLRSNKARTKQNLSNLRNLKHYDIEFGNNSQHDYAYAQCIATHNLGLSAYQEIVLEGLRREGYVIEYIEDLDQETKKEIREGMKEIKEENYSQLIHSIVTATPDETNISQLERKQELSQEERHQLKHWKIEQKYGVPIDEELIRQDDEGLHPHLSLQFWLTIGRNHVAERDKQKADSYLEKTEGEIYAPDFNRTQYQDKVQLLEILKIPEILALEGQEFTNSSLDWWWKFIEEEIISNPSHVRTVKRHLGVTLSNKGVNGTPIRNLQKLLKKIGMKLTQPAEGKRYGKNRGRDRKYLLERHSSHQDAIFRNWEAQLSSPAVEIAA